MKKHAIDLSYRQTWAIPRGGSPSFRNRNYVTGAGVGDTLLFRPNCNATMLWSLIQLVDAATIQLFFGGQAIGAAYTLAAGAFVRFPSTYLANNDQLILKVTAGANFVYEVAWCKDHIAPLPVTTIEIQNGVTSIPVFADGFELEDGSGVLLLEDGTFLLQET